MLPLLLTGAGFSYNWGAWLANEAFEYLLGCAEVDAALRDQLWSDKNKGLGFEATLGRLQQEASRDATGTITKQVDALTTALAGMFNLMDQGLAGRKFEFQQYATYLVSNFLARFGAIFTLNQDLLLERHYHRNLTAGGFSGAASPGIAPAVLGQGLAPGQEISARRSPLPPETFKIPPEVQPYFKLHGSMNWYSSDGNRMLVMGGNKTATIESTPVLKWYAEEFDRHLSRPGARLMIIGYGFADPHINASLIAACAKGLEVFIIDPAGSDVIDKRNKTGIPGPPDALMSAMQPRLIGASRRPLSATFGGDYVEYSRLMEFFKVRNG